MTPTVLVTGASGFIGRRVVAHLAAEGRFEVVTASRRVDPHMPAGLAHHAIDMLAPGAPVDLVARVRPTHLVHLAWNAEPGRFWNAPDNLDWAAATLTLVRAFLDAGGQRAVLAGTCAEYDWTGEGRLSESSVIRPGTLYGVAKDAVRRAVCDAGERSGVGIAWGRIFWLYGPQEARGRLVSDIAEALAAGRPVATSEGLQRRDFLHVDDVASAFAAALASDWHGPFNIGSGEAVPVRDLVESLAAAAGRPDLIRFGARPSPPNDPPLIEADIAILRDAIGFTPKISLQDGLTDTLAWWRRNVGTDTVANER